MRIIVFVSQQSVIDRVTGRKKRRKSKKSALVRAQERLQWLCYFGVGDIYLGETKQEYELQDDGTEKLVQDSGPNAGNGLAANVTRTTSTRKSDRTGSTAELLAVTVCGAFAGT